MMLLIALRLDFPPGAGRYCDAGHTRCRRIDGRVGTLAGNRFNPNSGGDLCLDSPCNRSPGAACFSFLSWRSGSPRSRWAAATMTIPRDRVVEVVVEVRPPT